MIISCSNSRLFQSLPLECSSISSAINEDSPFIYLTIPQLSTNSANIYVFSGSHFTSYQNISSENVEHVSSFQIGARSFLAIGGKDASVYKFTKSGLRREITDIQLQQVKYFLPIPVKNYRYVLIILIWILICFSVPHIKIHNFYLYKNATREKILNLLKFIAYFIADFEYLFLISYSWPF